MSSDIYILAGGGTGGHLYPGLAVAGELVRRRPEAKIVFACSDRPIDRQVLDEFPYALVAQPVKPLPRGLTGWWGFWRGWRRSNRLARDLVADLRPRAVLGLGGFAAAPLVRRAARAAVPTALLNPDAVPGLANRLLASQVLVVFCQFASTRGRFSRRVAEKVRVVGCPVRAELTSASRAEAMRFFELDPGRKTLLINGGSLGAASINEAAAVLDDQLEALADTWQVVHVTGRADVLDTADLGGSRKLSVRRLDYCRRMDLAYAAADLVLGRAGASTTAELAATGTPAVLMPYPYHKDQHQRMNAMSLAEAGPAGAARPAVVVCQDARDAAANAEALRGILLPIMRDVEVLSAMQQTASALARTNAAAAVADWLTEA